MVVPSGFDSYVRIDHNGKYGPEGEVPHVEGTIPTERIEALIDLLSRFTSTPDRCWFCIWDGFGFWYKNSHHRLTLPPNPQEDSEYERVAAERDRLMRRAPLVRGQYRDYFLFRGPLQSARTMTVDDWGQSPNIWWPDDRSWCVGTDIDLSWTYVAGSRECSEALLELPGIDTRKVDPSDLLSE